eukprot:scaffold20766_cov118-Isochrysis_galbana.AAC.4
METCRRHTTYGPATLRRSKRAALPPLGHASEKGTHAQTTDNTRGTLTVGVRPLPSATSPRGDERDMDQAAIGRGSNKQQGSTKHKGRGKSEHTDRDLSLGHIEKTKLRERVEANDGSSGSATFGAGHCGVRQNTPKPRFGVSLAVFGVSSASVRRFGGIRRTPHTHGCAKHLST